MTARRLSEASDDEMRALTGTSGMLCDTCGSTGHNTAGHPAAPSAATKHLLRPLRKMWCLLFPARLTIANVTDWTVRRAK